MDSYNPTRKDFIIHKGVPIPPKLKHETQRFVYVPGGKFFCFILAVRRITFKSNILNSMNNPPGIYTLLGFSAFLYQCM